MPPILVPSSAKCIVSRIVVIVKLNGRKDFILRVLFSFFPARNYLFKVSNLSARIRCESYSVLRMSMLTIFNINDVNSFVLMSLMLTVHMYQTLFKLLTLNRQTFAWFILKRQTFLKTRSGIL